MLYTWLKDSLHMSLIPDVTYYTAVMSIEPCLCLAGDVTAFPHMPPCLFNVNNQHWVAMLPQSVSAVQHIPVPLTSILTD